MSKLSILTDIYDEDSAQLLCCISRQEAKEETSSRKEIEFECTYFVENKTLEIWSKNIFKKNDVR